MPGQPLSLAPYLCFPNRAPPPSLPFPVFRSRPPFRCIPSSTSTPTSTSTATTTRPQMTMTAEEVLANGNTNLIYTYPGMTKTMRSKTGKEFKLHVEEGQFADSEILVLLGKSAT